MTLRRPTMSRDQMFRGATGAVAIATAALALVGFGIPSAANAVPGVPQGPQVIYSEDFENAPDTGNPQLLTAYHSASPQYPGGTYTAGPYWASQIACNGFILSSGNSYPAGACTNGVDTGAPAYSDLQSLAPILGTIGGTPTATNSINADYTSGPPDASQVEFQTVTPITLPTPSRYLTFSVDAAAENCFATQPQLQFFIKNLDGTETAIGGIINPCNTSDPHTTYNSGSTHGGHYPASAAFIATGNSIGIVLRNLNNSGSGNDGAIDNIQVLDETPQVDKSFGAPNPITGVSRLTFTITNTTDLAAKAGWSGTDNLPAGLVVATPANGATTCTNGVVTATAGGSTIGLAGDLATGQASCTFAVDVVPSTPTAVGAPAQVFQNCASNFSNLVGLNPPTSCATVSFPASAHLSVVKSSTVTAASRQGDVVSYSVVVKNTGGSDYTAAFPATMSDDLSGVLDDATYNNDATAPGPNTPTYAAPTLSWSGPLVAGASVTITYTMTLTLAGNHDLLNVATVPPTQALTPADATSTVDQPIPLNPQIGLVKTASPSDTAHYTVGQIITYTFVATNTGNVTLTNPSVTEDSFTGTNPMSALSCPPTPTLAPGAQLTCTATYTIVQGDIDRGSTVNTATSHGAPPTGPVVDSSPQTVTIAGGAQQPGITIDKTAGPGGFTAAGQVVTYSFLLTNTGNVTLTNAGVTEGAFTGSNPGGLSGVTCPAGAASMAPGATVTCTASYTLTQADVNTGTVTNDATSHGTPPTGPAIVSTPDDAVVTIAPAAAIGIVKTASGGPFTHVGQTVSYSFAVTNLGNVTLTNPGVNETAFSGTGTMSAIDCPLGSLPPAATITCTASYLLTQDDVDAGLVTNTATAVGDPPSGPTIASTPGGVAVPIAPVAGLTLVKSVNASTARVDQQVTYDFLVTNTGESTVASIAIDEIAFDGGGTVSAISCPATKLAPAATTTCTATYTTTAADLTAGAVHNTATVSGLDPFGTTVNSSNSSARFSVVPTLALTGATLAGTGAVSAGVLLGAGALLLLFRRRRGKAA